MANLLEFVAKMEDLVSPALRKVSGLAASTGKEIEKPHKISVDTSAAANGLNRLASLATGVLGAFGIGQVLSFGKGLLDDFNAADQATGQLTASLNSTKGAAGLTKNALLDMSTALMNKSIFDDDAITQAQSVLLTFTNIKGAVYQDALPAVLDLAQKMGGDLQGATVQVGKALNSPIQGITALQRVGVSFTESQKATIKSLVETGQTAEAQRLILKELNTEFGGSAEAAAKFGTGALQQLGNRFGNLKESIGGLLSQGIGGTIPFFDALITKAQGVVDWFGNNFAAIRLSFAPIADALQPLVSAFMETLGLVSGVSGGASLLTAVFNRLAAVIRFVAPLVKVIATVIGEVWVAIAKVVTAVIRFVQTHEWIQKTFTAVWGGAVALFKAVAEAGARYLGGLGDVIAGVFSGDLGQIKAGLGKLIDSVKESNFASVGLKMADGVKKGWKDGMQGGNLFSDTSSSGFIAGGSANNKSGGLLPTGTTNLGVSGSASGTASGSNKVTHITLNVGKMGEITLNSIGGLKESAEQIKTVIHQALFEALNDVNTLTAQ